MEFATNETLMAAMPHILDAPKTSGEISQLCHRPAFNKREFPNQLTLTRDKGIFGDRWLTQPWLRRADNSPDPRIQVSVLSRRVLDTVLTDPENMVHPGDPIIADLDLSFENLPVGSLLRAGTAVIRVSDEGEGIDRQHLPRLGERFYRVDKSRSIATGGTGLGLAIVKHVLLRHQGELDITSEPGHGSTFRIVFPLARLGSVTP